MRIILLFSRPICAAFLLLFACLIAPPAPAAELTVHAAASLTDALREIGSRYQERSGDRLFFNFGASSQLARQIREGAPGDLFLSADEAQMDGLDRAGLLAAGTRANLLGNTLAVIVPADSNAQIHSPADLLRPEFRKIAVAEPGSVPAGVYAKLYFNKLGLWERLLPKIVPTENVRASLAAVESGNVEAGVVYKTDALISRRVRLACEVPAADGPEIHYPLAMLAGSRQPDAARAFLAWLRGDEARAVFLRHGFLVLR